MLPVPLSHMENVLSLQTRQIGLCCCFSPEAQPSIRRIRLPTFNSTEHFARSNAVYESWEVFEKRLFHKAVNLLQKHSGASDGSSEKTNLSRPAMLWHKLLLSNNFSGLVHAFISDIHTSHFVTHIYTIQ